MSEERPSRRRALFEAAADLPTDQRDAFLRSKCAGDDVLRAEVDRLLRHDEESHTGFLQSPVPRPSPGTGLPATIGRYKVTGRLGTGGMGVVYEGAQESPQRTVAIKVIRPEIISERMLSRFHNEAEILGRLEHPGIARIYEAGTAAIDGAGDACPFFAMELVRGTPLLEYARCLTTAERLRLFAEVCDAVHHAHQKGVIHRDLKPANVLVTEEGQPKILDFGVARATNNDIQAVTMQTDAGQLLGTVPYMSPEQVFGNLGRLDTRSDVYSLGVVLFEMLTGELPLDVRERSVPEAARIIRDEESTRLSTVVPALRGDLEWIVAKALEKDVERRYDSASALAADVRRHLADEPVLAGPPSVSYRLKKFVRRNKIGVAWAGAAALLLAGGVATTVAQTVRAKRAESASVHEAEEARREADRARLQTEFLVWSMANASHGAVGDAEPTLRQALDAATARIGSRYGENPEAEADIRRMVGAVYDRIGAYVPAREQYELAYEFNMEQKEKRRSYYDAQAEVLIGLQGCERELGVPEADVARWYLELMDLLEEAVATPYPRLADAMRAMRNDLIVAEAPSVETKRHHLERVVDAYARVSDTRDAGKRVATYLLFITAYLGNTFNDTSVDYPRAVTRICDDYDHVRVTWHRALALWLEARGPAPTGEEELRVQAARRLTDPAFSWVGWWVHDIETIMGDALVQRGRDDDAAEIARRLTTGHRGMRTMKTGDTANHQLLEVRRGQSLARVAGCGHDSSVIHLVDQPEILEELAAGLEELSQPWFVNTIAESMASREGRSDRWYEVARRAAERARELAERAGESP